MSSVWNVAHRVGHCEKLENQTAAKDTFANIVLIHITREAVNQGGYL